MSLKEVLAKHGVRADKSLGQHFLVSERVVEKIVACCDGFAGILEIGPGPGVLTRPLTEHGHTVTALEVDTRMAEVLHDFAPRAQLVVGDALTTDLGALLASLPEPRAVVSNMPYNITGPLLGAVTDRRGLFAKAVLMMQKEVADKVLAEAGDRARGALSVAMQAQFKITRVASVPPGAFLPPPKVSSTVLALEPIAESDQLTELLRLVRAGFEQPRKTLQNNLSRVLPAPESARRIASAGLSPTVRPHELTWEQWKTVLA